MINALHKKRLKKMFIIALPLTAAFFLLLYVFRQNIDLYYTPEDLVKKPFNASESLRVGGLVQKNSVQFNEKNSVFYFSIYDKTSNLNVVYHGLLPNLFREGQFVVIEGNYDKSSKLFKAKEVLAKHDESYRPSESKRMIS